MDNLKWYCDTNRDHLHESAWEAENCSALYTLWQAADAIVHGYLRADEVEAQVNAVLLDVDDSEDSPE